MQQQRAFGVSLQDMAASGTAPVVLQDCLRWLALRGLTTQRLFQTPVGGDKRKLLALRHLYDTGRRPLRSKSCRDKDPHLIANLLLLWLGSLPKPIFPAALVPALVESQQSDFYEERVASVRTLLKQAEPFVVEALFPLFELLHHYWINQTDRDSSLQELGRLLVPAVFGAAHVHGLQVEDGGLLSDTVEMLISEYRPLFTQPFNLRRFEADAARQAAAEAQRAEAAAAVTTAAVNPPLLTPIRCQRLSVMGPEGESAFSDCCGTPLPESPFAAYLAADASGGGAPLGSSPPFGHHFHASRPAFFSAALSDCDEMLDQTLSDLVESTVSGMLFDMPLTPGRDGEAAATFRSMQRLGDLPMAMAALAPGAGADSSSAAAEAAVCGDQPMSPTAVLGGEGCDSTEGSDCDAPMAGQFPFSWPQRSSQPITTAC
ncbi:hypothetical protein D9Q98_005875 [Chlorella vulgaris]|uniref:Rho-GAP domain-containing protein n=1 Tax=Chlorella vulgaris TaxID=3077 RepID=A0A9D4TWJ5_CHLVU|nr:hypothetical protein D9Q98_005875 [Chlorella vulgaris]